MKTTSTHAILEVSAATYADVKERMTIAGVLADYLQTEDGQEKIVFGTVALAAEAPKPLNDEFQRKFSIFMTEAGYPDKVHPLHVMELIKEQRQLHGRLPLTVMQRRHRYGHDQARAALKVCEKMGFGKYDIFEGLVFS